MSTEARPRIFVQIPSYRDRECQWTVRDLFAKAAHPDRIFVGICWQFDSDEDADCFEIETRPAQVRRVDFRAAEAQGLGWARAKAQALWRGEEFTLQIDSHMRFVPRWDELMLAELAACPSRRPVLTIYPASYWPPDELQTRGVAESVVVQAVERFSPNGILQFTCHTASSEVPRAVPWLTAGLAGGFVFGAGSLIEDVPSDPELYFEGEEPNLAVRLWTHGYDLFSPRDIFIYHYYRRIDGRRPWNDRDHVAPNERSLARLALLFEPRTGAAEVLGRYGAGNTRSIEDYELFAGVDFRAKTVASFVFHYPYVYSDEVTSVLIGLTPHAPAADAHLFILDDEGVLYCGRQGSFYRLSATATYIWCAIEAGLQLAEIIGGLQQRTDLALAQARQRVHNQICHWQHIGALQKGITTVRGTFYDGPNLSPSASYAPRPPANIKPIERVFQILGTRVRVLSYGACYDQVLRSVFGHYAADPHPAEAHSSGEKVLQVIGIGKYHFLARNDDYPAAWVEDPTAIATLLLQAAEVIVREAHSSLLLVRAGIVERSKGAVLVIGEPVIVAALVAAADGAVGASAGGLAERVLRRQPELLADHMLVQLERGTDQVRYVPKPVVISESWLTEQSGWLVGAESLPAFGGFTVPRVRFLPFDKPASTPARSVTRVIAVRLAAAEPTPTVRALSSIELLTRLIHASAPRLGSTTVADAVAVIEWVSALPALELVAPNPVQLAEMFSLA